MRGTIELLKPCSRSAAVELTWIVVAAVPLAMNLKGHLKDQLAAYGTASQP